MTTDGDMLWIMIGTKNCICQSTVKGAAGSKLFQTQAVIGTYIIFVLTFPTGLVKDNIPNKIYHYLMHFAPFSLAENPARELQIPAYKLWSAHA